MDQLHSRYGEQGSVPIRSVRFYPVESEWWFAIRRGPDQGPYPTRASARKGLVEFLNDQFAFENRLQQDREVSTRQNKSGRQIFKDLSG
ncbi:MAG: DUF6316 family protein [Gammaproteobacteria bacterium]|nr:DUF6316 family protein [Gammaproteobacteria bacterium]